MDQLRKEARSAIENDRDDVPDRLPSSMSVKGDLSQLWEHVSKYDNSNYKTACDSLLTALNFLKWGFDPQISNNEADDIQATTNLFKWASKLALPSIEFAVLYGDKIETTEMIQVQRDCRLKQKMALEFIVLLTAKTDGSRPGRDASHSPDVILAMIIFTSKTHPWASDEAAEMASIQLGVTGQYGLWDTIEDILRDKLKPLFTKQRNPNITSEGRKNLHPVPLPRFDGSMLDDSTKPWKNTDIYATPALSWIVSQYKTENIGHLEKHFPLLVPAILSLIDDSDPLAKVQGCTLLDNLLGPIQKSSSDILARTNLVSVFEEAITPCLLSLPTITPEQDSLRILQVAYPVLLSLFKTDHLTGSQRAGPSEIENAKRKYNNKLAKILRSNLISSFNHVSYSGATVESSASFPHKELSTFLLTQISIVMKDLKRETTKYIQDVLPLLRATLSNPFGLAYPPLVSAAIQATQSLVLMAHSRVWRWRGELFDGLCACWLYVRDETKEAEKERRQGGRDVDDAKQLEDRARELLKITRDLQVTVYALKYALQNPLPVDGTPDADQALAKEQIAEELRKLVEADSELEIILLRTTAL
ncbi:hypothetical protein N7478_013111 [Penicillium angulare]|uniref:uncharacterized protein n=1 Tax=Penicillium angulare TaxID=116970 RepID=UPI00254203FD|nr:uncharacterized protein N7478_013111 [Penicillium angulare]KAJ5257007.1 hypothetical protein N7478_013111 [Penicillium angulare]